MNEASPKPVPTGGTFSRERVAAVRRSRRHPRPTQFDYLHLHFLARDLETALRGLLDPVRDVLDVWCGSRPYDDLLPRSARIVGLDVPGNPYGVADVVSDDVLPFPDASFDLVLCVEAFQWIPEPRKAVGEFRRVLRPGGTALVSVPFAFEYERAFESRYTESELRELFSEWERVDVVENGGRATAWTVLTASLLAPLGKPPLVRPLVAGAMVALNGFGLALDRIERRLATSEVALPMNLTATARKPSGG